MTDIKVRPPTASNQPQVRGAEGTGSVSRPFELGEKSSSEVAATSEVLPSDLVQQIRAGELNMEQAVEVLIEQALNKQPVSVAPNALRQEIRRALTELVQDDPTLAALASAMKR